MPLPADTYRQLTAMANASDRNNRPASLLFIPAFAVAVGLIVLLVSYRGFNKQRASLESQEYATQRIARLVTEYESLLTKQVDFSEIFPPLPAFENHVIAAHEDAGIEFKKPPTVLPARTKNVLTMKADIARTIVKGTVSNEKLEHILQWIHNVVNDPALNNRVYIDFLTLTPLPSEDTWSATIEFVIYETKRK